MQNSNINELDCTIDDIESKTFEKDKFKYMGFVKKGTEIAHGLGRLILKKDGRIYEGCWKDGKMNFFGRQI